MVVEELKTLILLGVTRVGNPTVSLKEDSRTKILVTVPPVGRTRGLAAGTKNTLIEAIKLLTISLGLKVLALTLSLGLCLKIRLNGSILLVEASKIGDKILNDGHVGEGVDGDGLVVLRDTAEAGKSVTAVDVHGARTADTLTARTTESDGRVVLGLDVDQSIKNHGADLGGVDVEALETGLSIGLRIESVDLENLSVRAHVASEDSTRGLGGDASNSRVHL